jgi:toxin-antitoxin system PIN domain toxin
MLLDANILLYAVDEESPFFERASSWLVKQFNGPTRIGLPWISLTAFVRLTTHMRALERPLSPDEAWAFVERWLDLDVCWTPNPTARHVEVFGNLVTKYQLSGNVVSDAHIAALAIEHGLTIYSADSDFARFKEVSWANPVLA